MKDTILEIIQGWDTAFQEKTRASYSVCLTVGRGRHGYYIMDLYRKQVEWPELLEAAKSLYLQYHPSRVLIENKASGQSLIQDLKRRGIPVISVNPDGDKYRRASAVTGLVQSGLVHLPEYAPWVAEYVEELAAFPESAHDDQIDATSIVLGYFKRIGLGASVAANEGSIIAEKKKSVWR